MSDDWTFGDPKIGCGDERLNNLAGDLSNMICGTLHTSLLETPGSLEFVADHIALMLEKGRLVSDILRIYRVQIVAGRHK